MNTQTYRLVFSLTRACLVAVAIVGATGVTLPSSVMLSVGGGGNDSGDSDGNSAGNGSTNGTASTSSTGSNNPNSSVITGNSGDLGQGVVATRINVRTGAPNETGSGIDYAWNKHGGGWGDNKSAFTLTKDELITLLQGKNVVTTPAYRSPTSGNYIRTVDVGYTIGVDAKSGGTPTTFLTVITDSQGNLVNTFPGKTIITPK